MHFRIALAALVFGGAWRVDDSSIHQDPLLQEHPGIRKPRVDLLKNLARQPVPFQPHPGAKGTHPNGHLHRRFCGHGLADRLLCKARRLPLRLPPWTNSLCYIDARDGSAMPEWQFVRVLAPIPFLLTARVIADEVVHGRLAVRLYNNGLRLR